MRNLIKADMQRILKKKSILLAFIFMVIIVIGETLYETSKAPDRNFGFIVGASDSFSWIALVLGIILVVSVYADDFKSTAYINVVGRGINRLKFIITKFIDVLIILVGMYACAMALVFGLKAGMGISNTSIELSFLFCRLLNEMVLAAAGVSIAALLFYITENNALGILAYLGIYIIIPIAMEYIRTNPTAAKYNVDRLYISGACDSIIEDFVTGQTGAGLLKMLLVFAVYVVAAIVASIIFFRKKELDF